VTRDELIAALRRWLAVSADVYDDTTCGEWIDFAEERISEKRRCGDQIKVVNADLLKETVKLPADYQELDFVRLVGGAPLRYRSRDLFFGTAQSNVPRRNDRYYTLNGNCLIVRASAEDFPEGRAVELTYFADVPSLSGEGTWLSTRYSRMLLLAALSVGAAYGMEDDRAPLWEAAWMEQADSINANYKESRVRGSQLTLPRGKNTFG